ncbi:MAG: pyridoxamine 5'-phosphate oxidase family protein, partial [Methyloligellaceae bacterium]
MNHSSPDTGLRNDITSEEQLNDLYGEKNPNSLAKEIDYISKSYETFISKSPFVVVSTCGPEGLDSSPRGDPAGFVRVLDRSTVAIPDRPGNNRLDSLRNLIRDPRISLLFLIPGIRETLRINGRARISTDHELLESFAINGKIPKTVLVVTAERIYFQCSKAMVRSKLWLQESHVERSEVPTAGAILQEISNDEFDGHEYDRNYPDRIMKT